MSLFASFPIKVQYIRLCDIESEKSHLSVAADVHSFFNCYAARTRIIWSQYCHTGKAQSRHVGNCVFVSFSSELPRNGFRIGASNDAFLNVKVNGNTGNIASAQRQASSFLRLAWSICSLLERSTTEQEDMKRRT